jgi:predicted nuclease of restriction endonuclease-like RecB superfamily
LKNSSKKNPSFKGGLEPLIYEELLKAKVGATYEEDFLHYVTHHRYVPDFKITTRSGTVFYLEVKGYFRTTDQVKMKAVKVANPNEDIRILFQKDNKLNKHSKMHYSDWAKKYNFPFAIGTIPEEWFV